MSEEREQTTDDLLAEIETAANGIIRIGENLVAAVKGMRIIECEQGTHEWHQARLGMPTASKISALFTATGKQSANKTRSRYALELAIERITKVPTFVRKTAAMERGTELEPLARVQYYLDTKRSVDQVGFVIADSGLTGCSPDGLVGDDGAIEIKCFEMLHYAAVLLSGEIDHAVVMQCQHTLYVTGRAWIDFVMFTDVIPFSGKCWIKRIERDEEMIVNIREAVADFSQEIQEQEFALIEAAGLTDDMLMFEAPIICDNDNTSIDMTNTEGGIE